MKASEWDIGIVVGVPAWIQILLERIIEYYKVENQADDDNDNLYLVGTAEVALASLHGGQTIITPKKSRSGNNLLRCTGLEAALKEATEGMLASMEAI